MRIRTGILMFAAAAAIAGCGKNKKGDTTANAGDTSSSVAKVDPTLCETSGKNVVTYDLNRDNRPDVWRLFKGEEEAGVRMDVLTCKQVDFDHDGRKDWVVAYSDKGSVLYERADFDYDGRFDMSSVYDIKSGRVIEVERDSDFDGKYDLKEIYDAAGMLSSVRKDRDANGEPDVWEQYKDGALIAILYDDDSDSKVDRREEVPGSRPKVEMPTPGTGGPAEAPIPGSSTTPAGTGTPALPAPVAPGAETKTRAPVAPAAPAATPAPATKPAPAKPAAKTPGK